MHSETVEFVLVLLQCFCNWTRQN